MLPPASHDDQEETQPRHTALVAPVNPVDSAIRRLESPVSRLVWASSRVPSLATVVAGLVENAIQAGARRVWVSVASERSLRVRVVDDGRGFSPESIRLIADEKGENGFLNALVVLAAVEIQSRSRTLWMRLGKVVDEATQEPKDISEVDVWELFLNIPVRKAAAHRRGGRAERNDAVSQVKTIALFSPAVAFGVENEETKQIDCELPVTHNNDCSEEVSWKRRFRQVHGELVTTEELQYIEISLNGVTVKALLCSGVPRLRTLHIRVNGVVLCSSDPLVAVIHNQWLYQQRRPQLKSDSLLPIYLIDVKHTVTDLSIRFKKVLQKIFTDRSYRFENPGLNEMAEKVDKQPRKGASSNRLLKVLSNYRASVSSASRPSSAPVNTDSAVHAHTTLQGRGTILDSFKYGKRSKSSQSVEEGLGSKRPRSSPSIDGNPPLARFVPVPRRMPSRAIPKMQTFVAAKCQETNFCRLMDSSPVQTTTVSRDLFPQMRVIGQVDKKFIAIECAGKLYVLDQHAADERSRYERLHKLAGHSLTQEPNISITIEHTSEIGLLLHGCPPDRLEEWGWTFSAARNGTTTSKTVPRLYGTILDGLESLISFTSEVAAGLSRTQIPRFALELAASCACHSAIRFGDSLNIAQCEKLLLDLSKCDFPFQCAHGRPSLAPLAILDC